MELKEDVSLRAARVTHGWWQKFKERNQSLSLRSGDSTAAIKLDAVNEENMDNYFEMLKLMRETFGVIQKQFINMDESGMPLEPRPLKIVAKKGQKRFAIKHLGKSNR